jgi:hypothetical protein
MDSEIMCNCEKCLFRDLIYCTHDMNDITPNTNLCTECKI